MVFAVVGGEFVFDTVEREFGIGDAVGETADDRGGTSETVEIFVESFCAEDNVSGAALAIECEQLGDDRALFHDARDHAVAVAEGENLNGRSILELPEIRYFTARERGGSAGGAEGQGDQEQKKQIQEERKR